MAIKNFTIGQLLLHRLLCLQITSITNKMGIKNESDFTKVCNYNEIKPSEIFQDMLTDLSKSGAVFQSQQIDDPDLTIEDKFTIAENLLAENPVLFLARFGSFLSLRHLDTFIHLKTPENGVELDYYIEQCRKGIDNEQKKKIIRNRRYEALKRLQVEGKYFSEIEMEKREPLLYQQLIGQHLTDKEKFERYKQENNDGVPSFSMFLICKAEKDALNERRRQQQEEEDSTVISDDEEQEDCTQSSEAGCSSLWGADWNDEEESRKRKLKQGKKKKKKMVINSAEKSMLVEEFKAHMYERFLDGKDTDFDYSVVDSNPEYDCLEVRSRDEEEKYFDDEETCSEAPCTDTGIEDY